MLSWKLLDLRQAGYDVFKFQTGIAKAVKDHQLMFIMIYTLGQQDGYYFDTKHDDPGMNIYLVSGHWSSA